MRSNFVDVIINAFPVKPNHFALMTTYVFYHALQTHFAVMCKKTYLVLFILQYNESKILTVNNVT